MAFTMSFFLHPNLKNYEGYRELSDAGKKDFRKKSLQGGGTIKGIRVVETAALYTIYFQKMMGIMQPRRSRVEEVTPSQVRLQFWQFFHYKTAHHLCFYDKEQLETLVLDKLETGGVKRHCLAAYDWMVRAVKLYLTIPEAQRRNGGGG